MRYIAALLALALIGSCATVSTTVKKDKRGQPIFEQSIKARSSAAVELAGQKFEGQLIYNPTTETYDVVIESGQDAENVNAQGMEALAALIGQAIIQTLATP